MAKKAGYYTDADGDTWLRLGGLAAVHSRLKETTAVWSWDLAKEKWGPMVLDEPLSVD